MLLNSVNQDAEERRPSATQISVHIP